MKYLVVVDMQNDFIYGSLGTPEAQAILPKVIQKIENFDGLVCATLDTHGEDYEKTQEGNLLPVKHCVANTHGWEIALDIACAMYNAQHHIEYFRKDTFGSYDLGIYLARQNKYQPIDEVVLVGLCTDICVISNALLIKAFLPEVKITVDASCCAGVSPESHENALRAMKMCQINIENWEG